MEGTESVLDWFKYNSGPGWVYEGEGLETGKYRDPDTRYPVTADLIALPPECSSVHIVIHRPCDSPIESNVCNLWLLV